MIRTGFLRSGETMNRQPSFQPSFFDFPDTGSNSFVAWTLMAFLKTTLLTVCPKANKCPPDLIETDFVEDKKRP